MAKKENDNYQIVAQNRKARYDYEILEEYEAGIALLGTEVKSLRSGQANIVDAHVDPEGEEIFLINLYIPEYKKANKQFNHNPYRRRKLLMHKKEIRKIIGKIQVKGLTVIPLVIYFNHKGLAKVKLALARGKTKYDKRESKKDQDWQRQKARIVREG